MVITITNDITRNEKQQMLYFDKTLFLIKNLLKVMFSLSLHRLSRKKKINPPLVNFFFFRLKFTSEHVQIYIRLNRR